MDNRPKWAVFLWIKISLLIIYYLGFNNKFITGLICFTLVNLCGPLPKK